MEPSRMLTCQALTEKVTDYYEGRLSLMRRVEFHLHLAMCPHCRVYVRQMKLTLESLAALPDQPVPTEVRDDLLSQFRSQLGQAEPRRPGPWSR